MLNINLALDISPLSPNHHFTKGNIYFLNKDYKNAITYLDECLKIDPNFTLAIETKLACFILLNDKLNFKNYIASMPQLISPKICVSLFKLINNEYRFSESELNNIKIDIDESFKSIYPWHFYFLIYSGNTEKALHIFEKKIKLKIGQLVNFRLDPFLNPLKQHKKYQLLEKELFSNYQVTELENLHNKTISVVKPILNDETKEYIKTLKLTIQEEKLYKNPNFSLKDLSKSINLHPNKLSWLLNEHLDQNFNEFINKYRLEHFKNEVLKGDFTMNSNNLKVADFNSFQLQANTSLGVQATQLKFIDRDTYYRNFKDLDNQKIEEISKKTLTSQKIKRLEILKYIKMKRLYKLSVIASGLLLNACGGGSSSQPQVPPTNNPPPTSAPTVNTTARLIKINQLFLARP